MMKKNGFTLAEVLITLAIIGVVASLTLPSLMANTGEQQSMTAYRKILNSLNEAGQLNAALNGFDYSTMTAKGDVGQTFASGHMTLGAIIHDNLKIAPQATNVSLGTVQNCAVMMDGTAICLGPYAAVGTTDAKTIIVDTNGTKGPNKLATCSDDGCKNKSNKKIYDQFYVTLYGGNAYAGKWTGVNTPGATNEDKAAAFAAGISK